VIVLDTHALLWFISNPDRIPPRARRLLDKAVAETATISVSAISTWEIAMLIRSDRLELTMPVDSWIASVEELPWLTFVPVDNRIALRSVALADFVHRDPADRIIVATSLMLNATLVTADDRLRSYKPVRTIWD
jgi:PIN domain nuclease of toxin-antitoxin system